MLRYSRTEDIFYKQPDMLVIFINSVLQSVIYKLQKNAMYAISLFHPQSLTIIFNIVIRWFAAAIVVVSLQLLPSDIDLYV
jgi:hypothetical protein